MPGSLVDVYKRFGGCTTSTFRTEQKAECVKQYGTGALIKPTRIMGVVEISVYPYLYHLLLS
jgi:hypothetical protein